MSYSSKLVLVLAFAATLAACAKQEEEIIYADPAVITDEPVFTGKYK